MKGHAHRILLAVLAGGAFGLSSPTFVASDEPQPTAQPPGKAAETKAGPTAKRESVRPPLGSDAGRRTVKSFRTWQAVKSRNVVMQAQEYSCGAAALATVAQYYFQDPVTEREILEQLLKQMTAAEAKDRQENGLSMDDLFKAAKGLGYQATVYPLELAKLKELQAPIIVRLVKDDFKHFVVFRGVVENRVWLADPLRGNVRIPVAEFARQWNGVALFLGKSGFGLPKEHPLALPQTPLLRPELQSVRRSLYLRP